MKQKHSKELNYIKGQKKEEDEEPLDDNSKKGNLWVSNAVEELIG